MQKTTTMKIAAGLLAAASVPPLCVYGAYRWAVWRGARPAPHTVSSIGVIGGWPYRHLCRRQDADGALPCAGGCPVGGGCGAVPLGTKAETERKERGVTP